MKYFKANFLLIGLLLLSTNINIDKGFIENTFDYQTKGISLNSIKKQNTNEEIDISETFVQIGQKTSDLKTHTYLRFATAIKINSSISSLSYIRNVQGVETAEFPINTIYKTLRIDDDIVYFDGSQMVKTNDTSIETEYYFACYTVELTKDEFKTKDFKLNLKINDSEYAFTSASYNTLLSSEVYSVKFFMNGGILGKQLVAKGEKAEYNGTLNMDDDCNFVGWDQDLSSVQSDIETNAVYQKTAILEAEDSQRQIITEKNSSQGTTLRLDKDKLIEYIVDASEDISAVMSMNLWSRGQIKNDMSILSAYDIYVNNELLKEGELTDILPFETFGKTWGESITAKVQNIHLNKGVNFIRIISKNTNILMLDNIELKYSGAGEISLSNMEEFQAVEAQTIEYVSTDGVETVGINGLTTNASYLGKFTKGSNIRLNTIDYVEFDFESNTDARVTLSLEMSLRALSENKPILELYKVFIKENGGEYQEILANNKDAINQSITSTVGYGEFHTVNVAYLNLKAGATYNLKLQSRANTHLENVMFISENEFNLVME